MFERKFWAGEPAGTLTLWKIEHVCLHCWRELFWFNLQECARNGELPYTKGIRHLLSLHGPLRVSSADFRCGSEQERLSRRVFCWLPADICGHTYRSFLAASLEEVRKRIGQIASVQTPCLVKQHTCQLLENFTCNYFSEDFHFQDVYGVLSWPLNLFKRFWNQNKLEGIQRPSPMAKCTQTRRWKNHPKLPCAQQKWCDTSVLFQSLSPTKNDFSLKKKQKIAKTSQTIRFAHLNQAIAGSVIRVSCSFWIFAISGITDTSYLSCYLRTRFKAYWM